jgi:hypothetical protein
MEKNGFRGHDGAARFYQREDWEGFHGAGRKVGIAIDPEH